MYVYKCIKSYLVLSVSKLRTFSQFFGTDLEKKLTMESSWNSLEFLKSMNKVIGHLETKTFDWDKERLKTKNYYIKGQDMGSRSIFEFPSQITFPVPVCNGQD